MAEDVYKILLEFEDNIISEIKQARKEFSSLSSKVEEIEKVGKKSFSGLQKSIKSISLSHTIQNIKSLGDTLGALSTPGLKFNKSMNELQALTGVTGAKLKAIEGDAKKLAKTYGGSAAQGVDSFKLILSQLGPELANTPEALKEMGDAVMITSKLMGGDQLAATEVLTAAMNQFGVSLEDPIEASKTMKDMMNVMAKAAAEGSAELPNIKLAIENAGIAAKAANVSFEETNAAIQVLDKAGKRGAEGGIALRNVMSTLAKGRFLPKDVQEELASVGVNIQDLTNKNLSLSERLSTLQPVLNDTALLTKTFGQANASAAQALISQTDEVDRYTEAVTGIFIEPKKGSYVVCSLTDGKVENLKILLFSEIENVEILPGKKMKLRGDEFGGLVKVQKVTDEINDIKQDLNTLKNIFNTWLMTSSEVSAAAVALKTATSTWSGAPLNLANKENLENENVNHG